MQNQQPFISRILNLSVSGQTKYGLEIIVDNPTENTIWVDEFEFYGKVTRKVYFSGTGMTAVNYRIELDCDLVQDLSDEIKYKIQGEVFESEKDTTWGYTGGGEFFYNIISPGGEEWEYQINLPVIIEIPPTSRSIVRLLFKEPSKLIAMHFDKSNFKGGHPDDSFKMENLIKARTNEQLIIEKNMDESFFFFLANSENVVKEQNIKTKTDELSELRLALDKTLDLEQVVMMYSEFGLNENLTKEKSKQSIIRELLAFLYQKNMLNRLSENSIIKKPPLVKILFLAANPLETSRLRLDEEVRSIEQVIRQSEFRDYIDIKQQWAVRITDIQGYLLRYKPNIIHFSGHGTKNSEIVLEDEVGRTRPVRFQALGQLLSVLNKDESSEKIRCVVLNACYSWKQANAISESVDCVIGMTKAIGDGAAIQFASAFYQALGYGKDIQTAFELGCVQIDLQGLDEQDTPQLISKRVPANEVKFIES